MKRFLRRVTMRRPVLIGGGAALVVALVGGLLIGSAFAQSSPGPAATPGAGTPSTTAPGATTTTGAQAAYQDFVNKLAKNLGISDPATVNTAIRTTLKQMVDEQLAAGHISQDQATRLKQQIDAGKVPFGPWLGGIGGNHRGFGPNERGKFGPGQRGGFGPRGGYYGGNRHGQPTQPGGQTQSPSAPPTGTPTM